MKLPIIGILSGVALATLGISSAAQAAIVVPPPGLNPGEQYRLVFVTSGTRDATSSDIAVYNQFVNNAAQASTNLNTALTTAGLTPSAINWTAIGSTATVNARLNTATQVTNTSVPIYRLDGIQVATSYDDLWDGTIENPINVNAAGELEINFPWTGTNSDGTSPQPLGTSFPAYGFSDATSSQWIGSRVSGIQPPSNFFASLYGISSRLTVPTATTATPEPSSLLSFITLGGIMLGGNVRGARK